MEKNAIPDYKVIQVSQRIQPAHFPAGPGKRVEKQRRNGRH